MPPPKAVFFSCSWHADKYHWIINIYCVADLINFFLQQNSSRRLSTESGLSSQEKLKIPQLNVTSAAPVGGNSNSKRGSRKLKLSESIASSLGSNLNRAGGAHDLTKMLLTDDYFSDVNPRSMRRLMNVVYITGLCIFNPSVCSITFILGCF